MRVIAYSVLLRCVEEGVGYGLARSYKHSDKPDDETIRENVEREVMNAICEYFEFGEPVE